MRRDMHKVIVERPRLYGRDPQRNRLDPESAPTKESMGARRKTKALNENLAPLRKFLKKSVGRPWDKVFSEICENIRTTSAVQAHVRQHLWDYVERSPLMVDGVPHSRSGGRLIPLWNRYSCLYVCPRTGLLKSAKPVRSKKKPRPVVVRRIDSNTCAVDMRGCWHEATMKRAPYMEGSASWPVCDAILGGGVLVEGRGPVCIRGAGSHARRDPAAAVLIRGE